MQCIPIRIVICHIRVNLLFLHLELTYLVVIPIVTIEYRLVFGAGKWLDNLTVSIILLETQTVYRLMIRYYVNSLLVLQISLLLIGKDHVRFGHQSHIRLFSDQTFDFELITLDVIMVVVV